MPAGEEEVTEAEQEGIHFLFQRSPVRVLGTDHVEAIVVQRGEAGPPDAKGRRPLVPVPGSEETIPCDTVIVAVGEKANLEGFPAELDLKITPQGWPQGKHSDWSTDVEGVFAAGGKSIVFAMGAGTAAANAIESYLFKKAGKTAPPRPDPFGGPDSPKLPDGYGAPTWQL